MKYNPYKYGWWSPTYIARRWSFSTRRQSIFYRSWFRIKETARNRGNEESNQPNSAFTECEFSQKLRDILRFVHVRSTNIFVCVLFKEEVVAKLKKGLRNSHSSPNTNFFPEPNDVRSSTICSLVYLSVFAQNFRKLHVLHNERNFWDDLMLASAIILHSITV